MPIFLPAGDVDLDDLADQAADLASALRRLADAGHPTASDLIDAPLLDCWGQTTRLAPALIGLASGHPRIGHNRATVTSEVFAIDSGGRWARTWSRFYRLADAIPSGHGGRQ